MLIESTAEQIKEYFTGWKSVFPGHDTSAASAPHIYSSGNPAPPCSGRLFWPLVPLHPSCQILALSQLPSTYLQIITFWERKFLEIQSEINSATSFLLCFIFSLVISTSSHLAHGCVDLCKFYFYHWDKTLLSKRFFIFELLVHF